MRRSPRQLAYALRRRVRAWLSGRAAARRRIELPSPAAAAHLAHRDILEVTRSISHLGIDAIMVSALRSRSTAMADIAVCALTDGQYVTATLLDHLGSESGRGRLADELTMRQFRDLHRLASVVDQLGIEADSPPARAGAADQIMDCITARLDRRGVRRSFDDHYQERAIAQRLIQAGAFTHAHQIVRRWLAPNLHQRQVLADFYNPEAHAHPWVDAGLWAEHRNALWTEAGLEAPAILPTDSSHGAHTFDRLASSLAPTPTPAAATATSPLVTVIMTTFRPGQDLLTGVRSVLEQTWQHFEILIMDDASGPEYHGILDRAAAMDARVNVVRADANAGTYVRRNDALALATGTFVTVHDSDDWMHPRRLELQVAHLKANPGVPANITRAYRMSERLQFIQSRGMALRLCEPALMWRREWCEAHVGHYDTVRKSADGEIRRRIEVAWGGRIPTVEADAALTIQRTQTTSLSGSEFGDNWQHDARLAYRSAYMAWHRSLGSPRRESIMAEHAPADSSPAGPSSTDPSATDPNPTDPNLTSPSPTSPSATDPDPTDPAAPPATYLPASPEHRPFPAPERVGGAPGPASLDVVVLGDFAVRQGDAPAYEEALAAVKAAVAAGRTVGLCQVWTPATEPRMPPHLHHDVQALINAGEVSHVVGDEAFTCDHVVAASPIVLACAPGTLRGLTAASVSVLDPRESAGRAAAMSHGSTREYAGLEDAAAWQLAERAAQDLWGVALQRTGA